MQDVKYILKGSLYLLMRVVLVCLLSFMAIPLSTLAPGILTPILGIFYTVVLLYFFVFTMWHEGGRDANRVETGLLRENKAKGFLSAGILFVVLCAVVLVPFLFPADSQGIFASILSVVKIFFSMSTVFLAQAIFPNISDVTDTSGSYVLFAGVFVVVYAVCVVASGIGYYVGYKRILIIAPYLEKLKKMWK